MCRTCPGGWIHSAATTGSEFSSLTVVDRNSSPCVQCGKGHKSSASGLMCEACPLGKSNDDYGRVSCFSCLPGRFSNVTGMSTCHNCTRGKVSRGAGARGCTECKQGFYQDTPGHSTCLPCVPGKVMPSVGAISCKDCQANYYAATTAMKSCVECEQGRSATQGSAKCGDCTAGKRKFIDPEDKTEMCVLCTAGKFQPDAGMDSCKDCQKGFYQDAEGQAACLPCIPGNFANETGLLKCRKCAIAATALQVL